LPPEILQFDNFELDLARYELRRGSRVIKLEKNPMELLILLAENPGRLVTREQIIQRLWGEDVFVDTRHGINTAIHKLRNALRDDSEQPRILETVVGKGYRLVAKLEATTMHDNSVHTDNPLADASLYPPIGTVKKANLGELSARDPKGHLERLKANGTWISLVIIVLVFLCIGIWWVSRTSADTNSIAIQLIPLAGVPEGYQSEASFAPDGNQVAFSQRGKQNPGIYTTLVDGEKSFRLTNNPGDCCPAWSPDGQQIVFSRYSDREIAVYVISALGGAEHQLHQAPNFSWNHPGYVAWSPDAKFIAFSDRQENGGHTSIALLSIADATTRRITTPPDQAYDYGPAFSPDGSQVAFIRRNGAGVAGDVYVVPSSGGQPRRLTFDNAQTDGLPAWTEDGREIVFSSLRGGLSTLWRVPAAGGKLRSIAGVGATSCCPSISRKGNRIVFQNSLANYSIWGVDLKDKNHAQELISAKGLNWRPDFSPDGSKIAFESDRSGYAEIWTCDSKGSNCGQLTSLHGVAGTARWSPDGRHIAFEFTAAEHSEIYVVDVDGGPPRPLPTLPGADNVAPSWSRDGKWIYFTSDYKSGLFDLWKVPLPNGSPIRVTNNGGVYGVESVDGRFLYYAKLEAPGVWRRSLNGGEETRILDKSGSILWYDWALARNGIYYLDTAAKPKEAIEFLDFESGKTTPVVFPDKAVIWGVTVSPDGSHLLYVQTDLFQSSLVLVKNFR
jgi:Tol biopolymer transport system component/DNA-binding winged helix-turn-helix (wHTH) protein